MNSIQLPKSAIHEIETLYLNAIKGHSLAVDHNLDVAKWEAKEECYKTVLAILDRYNTDNKFK
jgi:hypothetical protein